MPQKDTLKADSEQDSTPAKDLSLLNTLVLADAAQASLLPAAPFENAGCHLTYAATLGEARAHLENKQPEIVFLPLVLAGKSTMGFLNHCKTMSPAPYMIVVASHDQINNAAEAMHAGAFDCLFTPFSATRLGQTISDVVQACRPFSISANPKYHRQNTPSTPVTGPPEDTIVPREDPHTLPPTMPPTMAPTVNIGASAPLSYPQVIHPPINEDKRPTTTPDISPVTTQDSPGARAKLIGNHIAFTTALRLLDSIAPSSAPVFLRGEVGTGKELFARAMHEVSRRSKDRFVVVDCAALRADTLASDMFGHLRGAHPSASYDKLGMAHFADGGTLYFDEVSNLDLRVQSQLVRFVQSGEVFRLGDDTPTKVDIRLISSTSHDPLQLIEDGTLLKDLYYQLHVAPITLPPLRARGDDLVKLAELFLTDYAASENRNFTSLTQEAQHILRAHHWPGNVHELKSTIWNAVLQHNGDVLTHNMLPVLMTIPQAAADNSPPFSMSHRNGTEHLIGRPLAEIEQVIIEETIRANGGSVPKAARMLEVSPSTLYRKRENWRA